MRDTQIAQKIVKLLPETLPQLLEIGAGTGVLTQFLLPIWQEKLYAIEIDSESITYLQTHFPTLTPHLLHEDFLQMPLTHYFEEKVGIIGNFPYNISSPIFFKILENHWQIPVVVGMVQKEVGQRLAASAGSKTYGILSVLLQAFYKIEYAFTVNPQVFNPPPKVDSAVIRLRHKGVEKLECDEKLFKQIVKQSFGQRRKTLRNSLKSLLPSEEIRQENIFNQRPEQLSVQDFIELTQLLSRKT